MADGAGFGSWFRKLLQRKRAERHIVHHKVSVDRVWGDPSDVKWRSHDAGAGQGVTRDMSATGVYFETDMKLHQGSMIRFTIDFDNPIGGGKTQLECRGYVVRAEPHAGGKIGIAVKLDEQHLRNAKP